jgi:hypothetical protein
MLSLKTGDAFMSINRALRGRSRRILALLLIAGMFLSSDRFDPALGKVLDPNAISPEQPILSRIANDLDAHGIDVVYGRSTDYPLSTGSVRVAPLAGFTPNKRAWDSYLKETWVSAFQKGVVGFIAAVPNNSPVLSEANARCVQTIATLGADVCEFVRNWLSAPADQRVFIAFTKDDVDYATQVGKSLEKAGFTVFLFLKGKDQKPWADPAMVGEVFAQANFRIVIDSVNARGSPGVALERECCEPLLLPRPPATPLSIALQGKI